MNRDTSEKKTDQTCPAGNSGSDRVEEKNTPGLFAAELGAILKGGGTSQSDLARKIGVSRSYVNALVGAKKYVSPDRVDSVASALMLSNPERAALHRAAARDAGFRLDLPEDF